jgi:hypothetical protein
MVGWSSKVLKKISMYVKTIIFSQNNWVSRSYILRQIYLLDQDTSEFTYSNAVTRSNLKRRVYDSINVLYASDIVERLVRHINFKKEYFFKPKVAISRFDLQEPEVLMTREEMQLVVNDKLRRINNHHVRYTTLNERLVVLERLIKRNLTNEIISVKKLELGSQPLNFDSLLGDEKAGKNLKKRNTSKMTRKDAVLPPKIVSQSTEKPKERIYVPFYFYKLKSQAASIAQSVTSGGQHQLTLMSKTPPSPFLYEDFEIIKRLI